MKLHDFSNAVRTLWNIERPEYLACISKEDREFIGDDILWARFEIDPHRTFIALPDQDQRRVFAIVEARTLACRHPDCASARKRFSPSGLQNHMSDKHGVDVT